MPFDANGNWTQDPGVQAQGGAVPGDVAPQGAPLSGWWQENYDPSQFAPAGGAGGAPLPAGTAPQAGGAPPQGGGNPMDPAYIQQQLTQLYAQHGLTPTGPGTGPTDIAYMTQKILETGGWQGGNADYWSSRVPQEIANAGGGGGAFGFGSGLNMGAYTVPALGAGAGIPAGGQGLWSGSDPTGQSSLASLAAANLTSSPGYQFRLQQGIDALQRSAAAKGTLLTGGTAKALDRYGQDYAANEYANQYARLFGEQQAAFGQGLQAQQAGFGQRLSEAGLGLQAQGQRANQLSGLAQLGYGAAGQQANLGTSYAGQAGQLLGGQAGNLTSALTGIGNAQAAGTVGAANAWAQGLGGATNAATNAMQMYYLSQLLNRTPSPGTIPTPPTGYGVLA
jgi:hypothetical protein